VILCC